MSVLIRHINRNPGYGIEALRLFEAMTIKPSGQRKILISNTIKQLQKVNLWEKFDVLYFLAAHTAQAAQINWKNPTGTSITAVNSPTFLTDRGYTSDGSTSYLNTGLAPNTLSKFTLNTNHIGFAYQTPFVSGSFQLCGANDSGGINAIQIGANTASTDLLITDNSAALDIYAAGSALATTGAVVSTRTSSTNIDSYSRGVSLGSKSQTSVALSARSIFLLCRNNDTSPQLFFGSTTRLSSAHFGGSLTAAETTVFYNIQNAYLRTVGAV